MKLLLLLSLVVAPYQQQQADYMTDAEFEVFLKSLEYNEDARDYKPTASRRNLPPSTYEDMTNGRSAAEQQTILESIAFREFEETAAELARTFATLAELGPALAGLFETLAQRNPDASKGFKRFAADAMAMKSPRSSLKVRFAPITPKGSSVYQRMVPSPATVSSVRVNPLTRSTLTKVADEDDYQRQPREFRDRDAT